MSTLPAAPWSNPYDAHDICSLTMKSFSMFFSGQPGLQVEHKTLWHKQLYSFVLLTNVNKQIWSAKQKPDNKIICKNTVSTEIVCWCKKKGFVNTFDLVC